MPSLPLYNPSFASATPVLTSALAALMVCRTSLVSWLASGRASNFRSIVVCTALMEKDLNQTARSRRIVPENQAKSDLDTFREALRVAIEPVGCPTAGYQFDLNMTAGAPFEGLTFCYPRLATTKDHDSATVINVPLFSDLKRHDMGEGLADKFDQGTDVASISVTRREFLTRPLWGVGDTGPWLHDGRARTIRDAILLHESLGSEANPVIDTFKSLSCDDQAAIVEFLLSLRLPIDCRYQPCFDKAEDCRPAPCRNPGPRRCRRTEPAIDRQPTYQSPVGDR